MFATYFGHCILPYVLFPTGNVIIFFQNSGKTMYEQVCPNLWLSMKICQSFATEYNWSVLQMSCYGSILLGDIYHLLLKCFIMDFLKITALLGLA